MSYNAGEMPTYDHIKRYRADLDRLIEFGGSDNEQSIRPAFQNCLDAYCREHRERLMLVPELRAANNVIPDGTVKDSLRMPRGYWEAKDPGDDLDTEIQRKFNRGYPRDNIIFEDSQTAVLIQNREEAMRADMTKPGELHRLIRSFLDYELPQIEEFRQAQQQFKADLPAVIANLREAVEQAENENSDYQAAAGDFLALCRQSISPDVTEDDVREMLLQHILTKDIFLRVFAEDQFHKENDIAQRLDALEGKFFTGDVRREAIDRLRSYYGVIGRAADEIADYAEKQGFLKAIYEDFYKAYNPAAADRLGVVYTPNEVVDFIIRGTDYLLQKHFGRSLADDNVQILDPATGTGTFITNLIDYLPDDRLEYKYLNEIHANEVAILPYYIANLNIEYTYKEKTGQYLEFPNLCFVDTLDNMDWQGSTGGAVSRQSGFNLGGLSVDNWMRIQEQNEKTISVIIGNPPYNANQSNWNEFNPNRTYLEIDRRVRETYVKESSARKTKQYDMYKRFIRWASDRLADEGIVGFITNRAYLDSLQDDGFRKAIVDEFDHLYIVDLGGNYQKTQGASNIFGITIGVAIGFFVRCIDPNDIANVNYSVLDDEQLAKDKLSELQTLNVADINFEHITPDAKSHWLNQTNSNFDQFLLLANKQTKLAKNSVDEREIFGLHSIGVSTNRDEWVYDFNALSLRDKVLFFADTYNELLHRRAQPNDLSLKWSSTLSDRFDRGKKIVYTEANRILSMYRPYVIKQYFADRIMNDRLTKKHFAMFGADLTGSNYVICINGPGSNYFSALATDKLIEKKCTGTGNSSTFCLPLYRYTDSGERVFNITEWGIRRFREHYAEREVEITSESIFAYIYAVLHDPTYREKYAVDLLREFPRLPMYEEFDLWANMGQELLDLHIGFERVEPFGLKRRNANCEAGKARLRADKERGVITLDERTTLTGVPSEAWEYRLGSRSALEWVLDQYKEKKPRDPTIRERFNTYRFADHKEKVIDLLQRVCTVSVRTMEIVEKMERLAER